MTATQRRVLAVLVIAALGLAVAVSVAGVLTRSPRGPESSSYAVGHRGASGLATLLDRAGHPVRRHRVPVDLEPLAPAATAVVLGGDVPDAPEQAALARFVRAGGRLVVAVDGEQDAWVGQLVGHGIFRGSSLLVCGPLAAVPETAGVTEVESTGRAGFTSAGSAVPILGCGDAALATVEAIGRGRVVVIADPAVFQNFLLGVRDNAAFALAAAGGVDREVVFLEHLHGFRNPSGLAALPWRAVAPVLVLVLAGGAAALSRRRPGDRVAAAGPTPRRQQHQEALAAALAGGSMADLAPVAQQVARRAVVRATRLPGDAGDDAVRAAAERIGISAEDADLLVHGHPNAATLNAATRALERVAPRPHGGAPHA